MKGHDIPRFVLEKAPRPAEREVRVKPFSPARATQGKERVPDET